MYKMYSIGDRTGPWSTTACISLGVDIATSTEALNFLAVRNELISLTVLTEKFNLSSFQSEWWRYLPVFIC